MSINPKVYRVGLVHASLSDTPRKLELLFAAPDDEALATILKNREIEPEHVEFIEELGTLVNVSIPHPAEVRLMQLGTPASAGVH